MSDVTLERLQVEVEAPTTQAEKSISSLADTLGKLKNATKNLGLNGVAKQVSTLNTSLNGVSSDNAEKLNKLAQSLQTLSQCGKLKLSPSVATQIASIGNAAQSLNGMDFSALNALSSALTPLSNVGKANLNSFISQLTRLPQAVQALNSVDIGGMSSKISQLVSALTPLTQMGKNNLTSFVTQLQKLPQVMSALQSVNMTTLASQIQQLANALAPLATQMQSIANGFSAFPARIQRLIASTNSLSYANNKASLSYVNLAAKIGIAVMAMKRIGSAIAGWISNASHAYEVTNQFMVSLGEYAQSAKKYADQVYEVMGIDPTQWLENQSVFMTLAKGFGITSDRAYIMSQNLTQLGYDLTSFFDIEGGFAEGMQKLQSAFAGELEPVRRLGYDLSVARLQQEALNLGITKSVNAMTQAEKAELRYYTLMKQVSWVQGDMARTLQSPTNQLRVFKAQINLVAREIGNLFIPVLNTVLPYLIAFAKVLRQVFSMIGGLFGIEIASEVDWSATAGGVGSVADGLEDATSKAKELKNAMLGIDELNIISPTDSSGGGGSGVGAGGGGLDFELPTYDFLGEAMNSRIDEILTKMKEWLGLTDSINSWSEFFHTRLGRILTTVGAIGLGLAAWKVSQSVLSGIQGLLALKKAGLGSGLTFSIGISLVVAGIALETTGIIDAIKNELNSMNLSQIIAGALTTTLGGGFIGKALTKVLGAQLAKTTGNAALVSAGTFSATFASTLFTGGIAAIVSGIPAFVTGVWDSLKNGLSLLSGLLTEFGATLTGAGAGAIGAALGAWGGPIGIAVGALIGIVVGALTNFGIWLAQNWEEVSAKASEFWQGICSFFSNTVPAWWTGTVIPFFNGIIEKIKGVLDTVKRWIVDKWNSTVEFLQGIPAKIGAVIESVGQWFSELPGKIGYALGYALGSVVKWVQDTYATLKEKIPEIISNVKSWFSELPGKIWDAISSAVSKVVTWGSEMWRKFKEKVDSIVLSVTSWFSALPGKIWNAIITAKDKIVSWASEMIAKVKEKVPEIISSIVGFFEEIPDKLKALGKDIWQGLVDGLTNAWNTVTNAISDFCSNFLQGFKDALGIASPSKEFMTIGGYSADGLIEGVYGKFSDVKETVTEWGGKIISWFTGNSDGAVNRESFAAFGNNIVSGFRDKISTAYVNVRSAVSIWASSVKSWFTDSSFGGVNSSSFATFANNVVTGFKDKINTAYTSTKSSITTWASNVKNWFSGTSFGGINSTTFQSYATNIVDGFKNRVANYYTAAKSAMTTFGSNVKSWFTDYVSYDKFYSIASDVVQGFKNGIGALYNTCKNTISSWGASIISWFKEKLDSNSPSKVFERIGEDTILGYNIGITSLGKTTKGVVSSWADSFTSVSPVMSFAVDTSALRYYSSDSFAKAVSANVSANSNFSIDTSHVREEFREAVLEALNESRLAEDMRRQADKKEKTIVQVGNRTITDVVTTQQRANGYRFATT